MQTLQDTTHREICFGAPRASQSSLRLRRIKLLGIIALDFQPRCIIVWGYTNCQGGCTDTWELSQVVRQPSELAHRGLPWNSSPVLCG
jgi:hypothetical protein